MDTVRLSMSSAHTVLPGILWEGIFLMNGKELFSTQECAGHFNGWHKIVKQNNGRKKNKTNIKIRIALINDNAAVACIADWFG
jgi:hypothetical protein